MKISADQRIIVIAALLLLSAIAFAPSGMASGESRDADGRIAEAWCSDPTVDCKSDDEPQGEPPQDPRTRYDRYRGMQLLVSRNADGLPSNAPAEDPAISQDNRTAVAVAYSSSATDIVRQGTGGHKNIYLVDRRKGYGRNAEEPWKIAGVELASRGSRAPNGDSWDPTFDGDDTHRATCLAFLSKASNLVGGDHDHQADVFVRSLADDRLRRIAAPGAANSVDVDGGCDNIIYGTSRGVYIDGPGGGSNRIASGSAEHATIDTYARAASYERGGWIYMWREGKGTERIGRGHSPVISPNGKVVVFEHDGEVRRFRLLTGKTGSLGPGKDAAMTLTAVFIFWAHDDIVDATGLHKPAGSCDLGPSSPATSAHGNYVLFACSPGETISPHPQIYLSHIGGYSHGR